MNKKLIIILVSIILIGGGVAAYLLTRTDEAESSKTNTNSQSTSNNSETIVDSAAGSIRSLFNAGRDQLCTYSDQESSGTIYITDSRLRVDFASTNPEHGAGGMIMTQDLQHFWDNETKEGYVMKINPTEDHADHLSDDHSDELHDDPVDIDQEYDYSCKAWNVDGSVFTPPTDVNFVDMDVLMQEQLQQLRQ